MFRWVSESQVELEPVREMRAMVDGLLLLTPSSGASQYEASLGPPRPQNG